jgi:hypothetical protein
MGAGSGMVGMNIAFASIRYPPSCLVLTDGEDDSVRLMQQNVQQGDNTLLMGSNARLIHTTRMLWGDDTNHEDFEQECRSRFPTVYEDKEHVRFDCILAGDVLYKQHLPPLFFQSASHYMSRNSGVLFLCHVPRANVTHDHVMHVAHEFGFHVQSLDITSLPIPLSCPMEDAQRARLYRMTLD